SCFIAPRALECSCLSLHDALPILLCSRFLRAEADSPEPGRFNRACEGAYQWLLGHYEAGLKWVLRHHGFTVAVALLTMAATLWLDRKSTRLNSSHQIISYAVFCLK